MKNIVKFVIPFILVIAIPFVLFKQKKEIDVQKYDRITQKVFDQFQPTGMNVLILQNGEVIYQKALGYKNAHHTDFLDHNDIFNIASCSKAFTAAGIGKLVDDGLLQWDDKVIDYIPEFKLADEYITNHLTLRDILSHRTGLGTFYGDLLWYNTDYTNEEVIERMQYIPLINDFRSQFGYQNNMYMIAGEIIERVSGLSWEEYIQQSFLDPLNMSDTRTSSSEFNGTEEIAFPHAQDSVIGIYYFQATKAAASIWSSTRDLANWAEMWINDGIYRNQEILSHETVRMLTSPQTILSVSEERESFGMHFRTYAMGWRVNEYNGYKIIEHSGGMPGFISEVALIPEKDMAIIILNNGFDVYGYTALLYSMMDIAIDQYTNDWVEYYLDRQEKAKLDEKEENEKRLATKDTEILPTIAIENFAGLYRDKMYGDAEIKFENNELTCTLLPAKKVFTSKMKHWNKNSFKVVFKDSFLPYGILNFELNKSNKVSGFKIDLPSSDFHFKNLDFKKTP